MQQVVSESIVQLFGARRQVEEGRCPDPCRFSWRTSASGLQNGQPADADSNPNPSPTRPVPIDVTTLESVRVQLHLEATLLII